jgi:magnesium-transporting ATPase (P-type)
MNIPWILVSIAIGVAALAILAVLVIRRKGWNKEVDYRSYFNMGIVWLPLGIIFYVIFKNLIGAWFFIIGLVYLAIGLKNKDKWGKPEKISTIYQKALMIAVLGLIGLLVLGIIVFKMMR